MLAKKLANVTPSFTIGISTKVKELQSQGIDVTNLSIGEPDFFTPENVKEAAIQAINANYTKYDAASGLLELRKAIKVKLKNDNQLDYDTDQIVVSSGAKHAITNALMVLLDPADEVIIPSPYWVSYPEMVKLTGGSPVFIETDKTSSFKLTPDQLKAGITPKTKAIFITNPSNPTGAFYTREELADLVEICVENEIYILADEIYEKILFDDTFVSIASLSDQAYDWTITINGLSKSASMTGWRIGYTASNKAIAKAIASVQGHLVSHPSTISQWGALEAVKNSAEATDSMLKVYRERRDMIIDIFNDIPELDIIKPQGAFYIFIDLSGIEDKVNYEGSLSLKVCNDLLDQFKVAFVPGIAFGKDHFMRMSYATSNENIMKGLTQLKAYLKTL